jgi:hypothetical protein
LTTCAFQSLADGRNHRVHKTLAGASAKFKGQKVDPRAKGKAKAVTKAGRGASKPVYESTFPYSSRNGSVPGSPVSKKRKGVDLSPPPAAQRQLSPRSIAMMSSSPSQAVGLGLGAGPNTPVDAATGCVFLPLASTTCQAAGNVFEGTSEGAECALERLALAQASRIPHSLVVHVPRLPISTGSLAASRRALDVYGRTHFASELCCGSAR